MKEIEKLNRKLSLLGMGYRFTEDGKLDIIDYELDRIDIPWFIRKVELEDRYDDRLTRLNKITLAEGVEELGESLFEGCIAEHIEFTKTLRIIGNEAFAYNSNLEKLELKSGNIEKIGVLAFAMCDMLKSIDIEGIEKIDSYAFNKCDRLKKIVIKSDIDVLIGTSAFTGCVNIRDVELDCGIVYTGQRLFNTTRLDRLVIRKSDLDSIKRYIEEYIKDMDCIEKEGKLEFIRR